MAGDREEGECSDDDESGELSLLSNTDLLSDINRTIDDAFIRNSSIDLINLKLEVYRTMANKNKIKKRQKHNMKKQQRPTQISLREEISSVPAARHKEGLTNDINDSSSDMEVETWKVSRDDEQQENIRSHIERLSWARTTENEEEKEGRSDQVALTIKKEVLDINIILKERMERLTREAAVVAEKVDKFPIEIEDAVMNRTNIQDEIVTEKNDPGIIISEIHSQKALLPTVFYFDENEKLDIFDLASNVNKIKRNKMNKLGVCTNNRPNGVDNDVTATFTYWHEEEQVHSSASSTALRVNSVVNTHVVTKRDSVSSLNSNCALNELRPSAVIAKRPFSAIAELIVDTSIIPSHAEMDPLHDQTGAQKRIANIHATSLDIPSAEAQQRRILSENIARLKAQMERNKRMKEYTSSGHERSTPIDNVSEHTNNLKSPETERGVEETLRVEGVAADQALSEEETLRNTLLQSLKFRKRKIEGIVINEDDIRISKRSSGSELVIDDSQTDGERGGGRDSFAEDASYSKTVVNTALSTTITGIEGEEGIISKERVVERCDCEDGDEEDDNVNIKKISLILRNHILKLENKMMTQELVVEFYNSCGVKLRTHLQLIIGSSFSSLLDFCEKFPDLFWLSRQRTYICVKNDLSEGESAGPLSEGEGGGSLGEGGGLLSGGEGGGGLLSAGEGGGGPLLGEMAEDEDLEATEIGDRGKGHTSDEGVLLLPTEDGKEEETAAILLRDYILTLRSHCMFPSNIVYFYGKYPDNVKDILRAQVGHNLLLFCSKYPHLFHVLNSRQCPWCVIKARPKDIQSNPLSLNTTTLLSPLYSQPSQVLPFPTTTSALSFNPIAPTAERYDVAVDSDDVDFDNDVASNSDHVAVDSDDVAFDNNDVALNSNDVNVDDYMNVDALSVGDTAAITPPPSSGEKRSTPIETSACSTASIESSSSINPINFYESMTSDDNDAVFVGDTAATTPPYYKWIGLVIAESLRDHLFTESDLSIQMIIDWLQSILENKNYATKTVFMFGKEKFLEFYRNELEKENQVKVFCCSYSGLFKSSEHDGQFWISGVKSEEFYSAYFFNGSVMVRPPFICPASIAEYIRKLILNVVLHSNCVYRNGAVQCRLIQQKLLEHSSNEPLISLINYQLLKFCSQYPNLFQIEEGINAYYSSSVEWVLCSKKCEKLYGCVMHRFDSMKIKPNIFLYDDAITVNSLFLDSVPAAAASAATDDNELAVVNSRSDTASISNSIASIPTIGSQGRRVAKRRNLALARRIRIIILEAVSVGSCGTLPCHSLINILCKEENIDTVLFASLTKSDFTSCHKLLKFLEGYPDIFKLEDKQGVPWSIGDLEDPETFLGDKRRKARKQFTNVKIILLGSIDDDDGIDSDTHEIPVSLCPTLRDTNDTADTGTDSTVLTDTLVPSTDLTMPFNNYFEDNLIATPLETAVSTAAAAAAADNNDVAAVSSRSDTASIANTIASIPTIGKRVRRRIKRNLTLGRRIRIIILEAASVGSCSTLPCHSLINILCKEENINTESEFTSCYKLLKFLEGYPDMFKLEDERGVPWSIRGLKDPESLMLNTRKQARKQFKHVKIRPLGSIDDDFGIDSDTDTIPVSLCPSLRDTNDTADMDTASAALTDTLVPSTDLNLPLKNSFTYNLSPTPLEIAVSAVAAAAPPANNDDNDDNDDMAAVNSRSDTASIATGNSIASSPRTRRHEQRLAEIRPEEKRPSLALARDIRMIMLEMPSVRYCGTTFCHNLEYTLSRKGNFFLFETLTKLDYTSCYKLLKFLEGYPDMFKLEDKQGVPWSIGGLEDPESLLLEIKRKQARKRFEHVRVRPLRSIGDDDGTNSDTDTIPVSLCPSLREIKDTAETGTASAAPTDTQVPSCDGDGPALPVATPPIANAVCLEFQAATALSLAISLRDHIQCLNTSGTIDSEYISTWLKARTAYVDQATEEYIRKDLWCSYQVIEFCLGYPSLFHIDNRDSDAFTTAYINFMTHKLDFDISIKISALGSCDTVVVKTGDVGKRADAPHEDTHVHTGGDKTIVPTIANTAEPFTDKIEKAVIDLTFDVDDYRGEVFLATDMDRQLTLALQGIALSPSLGTTIPIASYVSSPSSLPPSSSSSASYSSSSSIPLCLSYPTSSSSSSEEHSPSTLKEHSSCSSFSSKENSSAKEHSFSSSSSSSSKEHSSSTLKEHSSSSYPISSSSSSIMPPSRPVPELQPSASFAFIPPFGTMRTIIRAPYVQIQNGKDSTKTNESEERMIHSSSSSSNIAKGNTNINNQRNRSGCSSGKISDMIGMVNGLDYSYGQRNNSLSDDDDEDDDVLVFYDDWLSPPPSVVASTSASTSTSSSTSASISASKSASISTSASTSALTSSPSTSASALTRAADLTPMSAAPSSSSIPTSVDSVPMSQSPSSLYASQSLVSNPPLILVPPDTNPPVILVPPVTVPPDTSTLNEDTIQRLNHTSQPQYLVSNPPILLPPVTVPPDTGTLNEGTIQRLKLLRIQKRKREHLLENDDVNDVTNVRIQKIDSLSPPLLRIQKKRKAQLLEEDNDNYQEGFQKIDSLSPPLSLNPLDQNNGIEKDIDRCKGADNDDVNDQEGFQKNDSLFPLLSLNSVDQSKDIDMDIAMDINICQDADNINNLVDVSGDEFADISDYRDVNAFEPAVLVSAPSDEVLPLTLTTTSTLDITSSNSLAVASEVVVDRDEELRLLKRRERYLKTALEVQKIKREIDINEKLLMYQATKLVKARELVQGIQKVEAEHAELVNRQREDKSQCMLRASKKTEQSVTNR